MSYLPIIINNGQLGQLPSGEALDVGGWTLPIAGGTENYALQANGSGNAIWKELDHGALAGLSDDDHPQYVPYTGASGMVNLGSQQLTTTGLMTAGSLNVDNITIDGANITSDNGRVNFSGDDVHTDGKMTAHSFIGDDAPDADNNRIYAAMYSHRGPSGPTVGTMKINLPTSWTGSMLTIRIRGFNYSGIKPGPWEVIVGGYLYEATADWRNPSAIVTGAYPPFSTVRLGHDGTYCCILLGDMDTTWTYPQVHIMDCTAGYNAQFDLEDGWTVELLANETGLTDIVTCDLDISKRKLVNNETIYVKTTGDDGTGWGNNAAPYLTLDRAIKHLGYLDIGEYNVTVVIGPGVYSKATEQIFDHPQGNRVTFQGDHEVVTSQSTTSISATDYDLPTADGDLDYYEATITLTGKTLTAGDYILIYNATGGTNPEALQGCHKVESFASDIATIRVVHYAGTSHASGTVNFDCTLVRTVLAFTNSSGLKGDNHHLGSWKQLVIQGDETETNCNNGIELYSAKISITNTLGIRGWRRGILAADSSTVRADVFSGFVSCCYWFGFQATNGSMVDALGCYVSGCGYNAFRASRNSTIGATGAYATGIAAYSLRSEGNSWIDFTDGTIKASTNNVLYASDGGGITAEAEDVSATQVYYDSTATCSPARDTEGNGDGIMRGGPY
jgi:hypothetical protein